jgi:hypothetical protein
VTGDEGVTTVEFQLTGGPLTNALIATAIPTYYGWLASWNSTTVPNGTYTLQSVASDGGGNEGAGPGITIIVENTPTTSVLVPSNGTSESGTQVVLDAGVTGDEGVTTVEFQLTGGLLNGALIATAIRTYYGWVAYWNSTTVPDGTYSLRSVAYDAGANEGVSPAVSVTVAN